jgi:hypothetical protein
MTAIVNNVNGANTYALQSALGAYSDEAYTNAKKLSGTGITSPNPNINTSTETFIGQVRWYKPLNPTINIASLTDATNGTGTTYASDFSTYIKTVRTHGATQVNLQQVVTQQDGLAKIGRDFGETRAQDEHNSILAVLKGVAIAEALNGACSASGATGLGGQSFTNDPTDQKYGFYVDLGSAAPVVAATAAVQGAARAEGFLNAVGMAWKDYEPEYAYLIVSPETLASLRSANLVDETKVSEANVVFDTIFGGKFRLIQTRAAQSFSTAQLAKINGGAGVDIVGTKTSFIVLPGAIAMESLAVPDPVEVYRDARAYKGGGSTDIWYRWGNVYHPGGYDWAGQTTVFPSDAHYGYVYDTAGTTGGTPASTDVHTAGAIAAGMPQLLTDVSSVTATLKGTWTRKASSALSLGILPVFHS